MYKPLLLRIKYTGLDFTEGGFGEPCSARHPAPGGPLRPRPQGRPPPVRDLSHPLPNFAQPSLSHQSILWNSHLALLLSSYKAHFSFWFHFLLGNSPSTGSGAWKGPYRRNETLQALEWSWWRNAALWARSDSTSIWAIFLCVV